MIKKVLRKIKRGIKILFLYPYYRECLIGIQKGWFPVFINYPVYPKPRFGYNGQKPHRLLYQIINRGGGGYNSQLEIFKKYESNLLKIKTTEPNKTQEPYWDNGMFSGLDAVALYSFIAEVKPKIYLEIGSGNSTKFVRKSIRDHELATKIISIDPCPRVEIDVLSDEIIRQPLEETNIELFDVLTKDDILFFDGSHNCFMNSDVTVFFLEILPRLPSGILIHIHDIHLPYDYPPQRSLHYESEQYLIAVMLLGECSKYEIILPSEFVHNDDSLADILSGLWESETPKIPRGGSSFWIRKKE